MSPSDKKIFCKISGLGVIFIGIGLLVTAIIIGITDSALSFTAFVLGFVVGLALLIYAGAKYNLTLSYLISFCRRRSPSYF